MTDTLIRENKLSFEDLPPIAFEGKSGRRRQIQKEYTLSQKEYFSPYLKEILQEWEFPLHFIDFETISPAIPFYKGTKPYELNTFQWSCHTIEGPGEVPKHKEWLNTKNLFPNFNFASSLKEDIGN